MANIKLFLKISVRFCLSVCFDILFQCRRHATLKLGPGFSAVYFSLTFSRILDLRDFSVSLSCNACRISMIPVFLMKSGRSKGGFSIPRFPCSKAQTKRCRNYNWAMSTSLNTVLTYVVSIPSSLKDLFIHTLWEVYSFIDTRFHRFSHTLFHRFIHS